LQEWKKAQLAECREIRKSWPLTHAEAAEVVEDSFDARPERRGRRWKLMRSGSMVGVLLIAIVVVCLVILREYRNFQDILATPVPPDDPGEVHLFFDRPGVPALIEARITPYESASHIFFSHGGETDFDYQITILPGFTDNKVNFALIMTGAVQASEERFYSGGPKTQNNGCWFNVYVIPEADSRCVPLGGSSDQLPDSGLRAARKGQVVFGSIVRNTSGAMFAQVHMPTPAVLSSHAGKRTYFRLPGIGTTYLPVDGRNLPLQVGLDIRMFVPSNLDVVIDYDKVGPTDRLENVAPQPATPDRLAWVETNSSLVRPHGSSVDTIAEDRAQRDLFIIGVLVGFVPPAIKWLITAVRRQIRALLRDLR
jgi:hypothetical protein